MTNKVTEVNKHIPGLKGHCVFLVSNKYSFAHDVKHNVLKYFHSFSVTTKEYLKMYGIVSNVFIK